MPRKWLIATIVIVLAGFGAALLPLRDWSEDLETAMASMELAPALIVFCALNVIGTLLFLPTWIFPLVAGAVFGLLWGSAIALISTALSVIAAFLLARHLLRERIARAARDNPRFRALDRAVARDGWKIVALLRMSPVLPSGVKSYFLGLTGIALSQYTVASLVGMLPGTLLKVYVGAAGRDVLRHGGATNWLVLTCGIAALAGLALMLARHTRRVLDF
jgi:uncharacterized membrane protein YdjX (TVP38/TMEM64 family)